MPLLFNSILEQSNIPLKDVRLIRHKDRRADKGKNPFELWLTDHENFEKYQSIQSLDSEAKLRARYWASFVGTNAGETLFVGVYEVISKKLLDKDEKRPHMEGYDLAGTCHKYELNKLEAFNEYEGRLFVEWGLGDRAWVQRADKQSKAILELRKEYKEPDFPGFIEFSCRLSEIESLPSSWISILKNAKGIYILTCPKTKEQYVGSAIGSDGLWGRWSNYSKNGDGGNIALKSREHSDYQVSILEVSGTSMNDNEILRKESIWKDKLKSREMGLNRN